MKTTLTALLSLSVLMVITVGCSPRPPALLVDETPNDAMHDFACTEVGLLRKFPELIGIARGSDPYSMPDLKGFCDEKTGDCYYVVKDVNHPTVKEKFVLQHEHVHRLMMLSAQAGSAGHAAVSARLMKQAGDLWRDLAKRSPVDCTHPELNKLFGVKL